MELTMFASPTRHAQRDWPIQAAHRLSNRVAEVAEQLQEPPHLLPPRRKRDEMDRKCLDTEVGGWRTKRNNTLEIFGVSTNQKLLWDNSI